MGSDAAARPRTWPHHLFLIPGTRPISRSFNATPVATPPAEENPIQKLTSLNRIYPARKKARWRRPNRYTHGVTAHLVGYARVSTNQQDLTAQRNGLAALGVSEDRIYTDHGLTGTNRARPGLREAMAAVRAGDTLVVTKLDRLARSVPDARDIVEELTKKKVKLSVGGSVHDPTDPVGRLLFNVLAMVAEFETDLIRARTREGMQVAKAKGRLRGKQPKLSKSQEAHLVSLYKGGQHTTAEIAELFKVARSTVYRIVQRTP